MPRRYHQSRTDTLGTQSPGKLDKMGYLALDMRGTLATQVMVLAQRQ
jgi:hypothetical protein